MTAGRDRRNSIVAHQPESEGEQKKNEVSAQHCHAVDGTRLGAEETVWEDERDVVEEPDFLRASACWARDVPLLALNTTSSGLGISKANPGMFVM